MNFSTEKKVMGLENRLVIALWGGGGNRTDWELGVNGCKLLLLEWISNEILLCSTGDYVWSLMMEHDYVRKRIYMCDWVPCCTVENYQNTVNQL